MFQKPVAEVLKLCVNSKSAKKGVPAWNLAASGGMKQVMKGGGLRFLNEAGSQTPSTDPNALSRAVY